MNKIGRFPWVALFCLPLLYAAGLFSPKSV